MATHRESGEVEREITSAHVQERGIGMGEQGTTIAPPSPRFGGGFKTKGEEACS
jgi:hypothetical protein